MPALLVATLLGFLPQGGPPAVPSVDIEGWVFSFGTCFASVGDVDDDGIPDVLVGDDYGSERTARGTRHGLVWLLSGADATVLRLFRGRAGERTFFGDSVAGLGDVDGDGVPDFAIGEAVEDHLASGTVTVFSGADFSVIHSFERMRGDVAGVGDLDGDGRGDILTCTAFGERYVLEAFSGKDASFVHRIHLRADSGLTIAGLGDVDGDGHPDFGVGYNVHLRRNAVVRVFSGESGRPLWVAAVPLSAKRADVPCCPLPPAVSAVGEVDGDGHFDVALAPSLGWCSDKSTRAVTLLSGTDGSILREIRVEVGQVLAAAGDVNGDGSPDLVIGGGPGAYAWERASVFSAKDGSRLLELRGDLDPITGDRAFGASVGGAGDLDADGLADVLIGSSVSGNPDHPGAVTAFSGKDGSRLWRVTRPDLVRAESAQSPYPRTDLD